MFLPRVDSSHENPGTTAPSPGPALDMDCRRIQLRWLGLEKLSAVNVELQGADDSAAICKRTLGYPEIEAHEVVAVDNPREDVQLT